MKKSCLILTVALLLTASSETLAQDSAKIKSSMLEVYDTFKKLLLYVADERKFKSSDNAVTIKTALDTLSSKFHGVASFAKSYAQQPGFAINLKLMSEMLDDARHRFNEGKTEYALWRLKTAASHCVSCHTSHKVDITFEGSDEEVSKLTAYERGEFYLATRQLAKSKEAFYQAAKNPGAEHYSRIEALRKWLIIYTRVTPNPQEALATLNAIAQDGSLQRYELEEIDEWRASLKRWAGDSEPYKSALDKAEELVRFGLREDNVIEQKMHTVEILRASSLIHKALAQGEAHGKDRSHALYLLGVCYSRLKLFFINELPELYLEQCVREYPASKDAVSCYNLYKDLVLVEYTGSSGTHLPGSIAAKLRELSELAQGIKRFDGRV